MSTPFWTFVIQIQTCTATTGGIAQTRMRPTVRRMRTAVQRRLRSSAISVPPTIVRLDVDGGEDDRAQQRVPEDLVVEDAAEVLQPDVGAGAVDQLEEAEPLERDPDEVVDRVGQDRPEHEDDRCDEEVRHRAAGDPAPAERTPPRPPDGGLGGGSQRGGGPIRSAS